MWLWDKDAKDLLIQKLRENGHVAVTSSAGMLSLPTPSRGSAGSGAWPAMAMQYPITAPFLPF